MKCAPVSRVYGSSSVEHLPAKWKVAGSITAHGADFWMQNVQVNFILSSYLPVLLFTALKQQYYYTTHVSTD